MQSRPLISDRYKADPFPVPRSYPAPAHTPNQGDTASSPVARMLASLHDLEKRLTSSRSAMEESEAERIERFPDASGATHNKPFLANQRKKVRSIYYADMTAVAVSGDLVAVASGVRVEVWSASNAWIGWCEVGMHGIGTNIVTALCFSQSGRYLWVGTHNGQLFEFDTAAFASHPTLITASGLPIVAHRHDAHPVGSPVIHISRSSATEMCTIDASGRIVVWLPDPHLGKLVSLHAHSKVLKLPSGPSFVEVLDGRVWASWELYPSAKGQHKQAVLRAFDISGTRAVLLGERKWTIGVLDGLGQVTSGCVVPSHPEYRFFGHDSGHISIWHQDGVELIDVKKVSLIAVTALCGPSRFLWAGFDNGMMEVIDVASCENWRVIKRWRGHLGTILSLALDTTSLWTASSLRVFSAGADLDVRFWVRPLIIPTFLYRTTRMSCTVDIYCRFSPLKLGIFTWNVDGQNPADLEGTGPVNHELLGSFLTSLEGPDLVLFNFQELIDLSDLTLAARTVLFATKTHDVTGRYHHWLRVLTKAVQRYLGGEFELVRDEKLVGLYTVLFARHAVKSRIRDLAAHRIKTGFNEAYGNKGSILLRLVLDDSSFCFVNSHLAAGKTHPAERERDLIEILDANPVFPRPSECTHRAYVGGGDGTQVSDAEMVFFVGDLNFRIDLPREEVLQTLTSSDSPQDGIARLLPHDELTRLRRTSPSFRLRSFSEAPLTFPPTYKYDHRSGRYDTSAKQRTPSWCDRVLWRAERPASVVCESYGRFEADISDHRPVAASFSVQVRKADPVRTEEAYRNAVHDWAKVAEGLLETAREYYPPMM
ncbi:hypothetical protein JCM10449v2_001920 [Rhodotorula kratochvilovae]